MSESESSWKPEHPKQLYTPGWHEEARTPVVDGKYYDLKTGKLCVATGAEYSGPPAVDIIIKSQHEDTVHCCYRSARPFPLEVLLCNLMRVVEKRSLEIDTLTATPYAIRLILTNEMTVDGFYEVADEISNGVWEQK